MITMMIIFSILLPKIDLVGTHCNCLSKAILVSNYKIHTNKCLVVLLFCTKTYLVGTVNVLKFQTFYFLLFWPKFCFLLMQLFLKILSGMAKSVDPDQAAPSGAV